MHEKLTVYVSRILGLTLCMFSSPFSPVFGLTSKAMGCAQINYTFQCKHVQIEIIWTDFFSYYCEKLSKLKFNLRISQKNTWTLLTSVKILPRVFWIGVPLSTRSRHCSRPGTYYVS